jgi:hypothetical protein
MNLQPYLHNYHPIENLTPYSTPLNYINKNEKSSQINHKTRHSR